MPQYYWFIRKLLNYGVSSVSALIQCHVTLDDRSVMGERWESCCCLLQRKPIRQQQTVLNVKSRNIQILISHQYMSLFEETASVRELSRLDSWYMSGSWFLMFFVPFFFWNLARPKLLTNATVQPRDTFSLSYWKNKRSYLWHRKNYSIPFTAEVRN
jgi:hypothetical protein